MEIQVVEIWRANLSIKKLEIPKLEVKMPREYGTTDRQRKKEEKPNVYTSLTTEKAEIEARQPVS